MPRINDPYEQARLAGRLWTPEGRALSWVDFTAPRTVTVSGGYVTAVEGRGTASASYTVVSPDISYAKCPRCQRYRAVSDAEGSAFIKTNPTTLTLPDQFTACCFGVLSANVYNYSDTIFCASSNDFSTSPGNINSTLNGTSYYRFRWRGSSILDATVNRTSMPDASTLAYADSFSFDWTGNRRLMRTAAGYDEVSASSGIGTKPSSYQIGYYGNASDGSGFIGELFHGIIFPGYGRHIAQVLEGFCCWNVYHSGKTLPNKHRFKNRPPLIGDL